MQKPICVKLQNISEGLYDIHVIHKGVDIGILSIMPVEFPYAALRFSFFSEEKNDQRYVVLYSTNCGLDSGVRSLRVFDRGVRLDQTTYDQLLPFMDDGCISMVISAIANEAGQHTSGFPELTESEATYGWMKPEIFFISRDVVALAVSEVDDIYQVVSRGNSATREMPLIDYVKLLGS